MIWVWFQEGGDHFSTHSFRTTVLQTVPSHCLFFLVIKKKGVELSLIINLQNILFIICGHGKSKTYIRT